MQIRHPQLLTIPHLRERAEELSAELLRSPWIGIWGRHWLPNALRIERFPGKWYVALRSTTGAVNERTAIAAVIPPRPCVHSISLITGLVAGEAAVVVGAVNSFVYDYLARRQIAGMHFSHGTWRQLPIPAVGIADALSESIGRLFFERRVLELSYAAWDLSDFARDIGYDGPPFVWDESRRFMIRCELDAAYFHRYLGSESEWRESSPKDLCESCPTPREAVSYIMDTFPIVKRKDEQKYGHYRTKDTILEIYDEMQAVMAENAAAVAAGREPTAVYQTRLNPPPGPPCDEQGNFIPQAAWDPANWPPHIHRPREAVVAVPEEVPVAEFAAMAYPATDADKAICAAALAVVEQSGGISSMEHLDTLLLATHPDWCKALLDQSDQTAFDAARGSAPAALFVGQNQSIRWKDCRDYLEKLNALTVAHGSKGQPISAGTALASVKVDLPTGVDDVVKYALRALERIRELRKDLSSVPQVQRVILDAFEEQHRLYDLVA